MPTGSSAKIAILCWSLVAFACERSAVPNPLLVDTETMPNYLALGDSYTIGEGVAPQDRWPVVLAESLKLEPTIVARTGWTVEELEAGIAAQTSPDATYRFVTLLIGVNDEFRGGEVETYATDFERVLGRAVEFAGDDASLVTVVSIPDYGVTPAFRARAGISERIDAFNATAREITASREVRWVDVTEVSRQMPDAVVADGLHPNAEQYRAWAALIEQSITAR